MERIYELCRCFRNGGESGPLHHCEFTMLEWYRAFADYQAIMGDVEELGWFLAQELGPEVAPSFRGIALDWRPPWSRRSLKEVRMRRILPVLLAAGLLLAAAGCRGETATPTSNVPTAEALRAPLIKSPSQCPGTSRSSISGGRSMPTTRSPTPPSHPVRSCIPSCSILTDSPMPEPSARHVAPN